METPEQVKDRERLERYIYREQLVSVMNNTKWQRLIAVLEAIPIHCSFRRKDVREPFRDQAQWDWDLYHVFGALDSIEWIDINARLEKRRGQLVPPDIEDHTDEVQKALLSLNIPHTVENGNIRVWGYIRPGHSPQFL